MQTPLWRVRSVVSALPWQMICFRGADGLPSPREWGSQEKRESGVDRWGLLIDRWLPFFSGPKDGVAGVRACEGDGDTMSLTVGIV